MTRDERRSALAAQFFSALLTRDDGKLDLSPTLGENQIRICFTLAEAFLKVDDEWVKR